MVLLTIQLPIYVICEDLFSSNLILFCNFGLSPTTDSLFIYQNPAEMQGIGVTITKREAYSAASGQYKLVQKTNLKPASTALNNY